MSSTLFLDTLPTAITVLQADHQQEDPADPATWNYRAMRVVNLNTLLDEALRELVTHGVPHPTAEAARDAVAEAALQVVYAERADLFRRAAELAEVWSRLRRLAAVVPPSAPPLPATSAPPSATSSAPSAPPPVPSAAPSAPPPASSLSDPERRLIEPMRDGGCWQAARLGRLAGYSKGSASHVRGLLTSLARRGVVARTPDGWRLLDQANA
jgi:hypothetical protein